MSSFTTSTAISTAATTTSNLPILFKSNPTDHCFTKKRAYSSVLILTLLSGSGVTAAKMRQNCCVIEKLLCAIENLRSLRVE